MSAVTLRDLLTVLAPISPHTAETLLPHTELRTLKKHAFLEQAGQHIQFQFVVKSGIVRKFLTNAKGEEFTVNFFRAGQAVTPALLRGVEFVSFVNLEVISAAAEVYCFSFHGMQQAMEGAKDLERFGFAVMMREAFMMAEREKILLTASGKEKLAWFRKHYPNLENEIPHYHIASFLGLTPTSLSRLRAAKH
jgi:hypothetical protein